jgi:excisionase family DNA binding protein
MAVGRYKPFVPSPQDARLAAEAARSLSGSGGKALRLRLDNGNDLPLPKAATRLLNEVLIEMSAGHAVAVTPLHAELTTQQAADMLNVSRPHLVRLLDDGKVPHHRVGTHRRVRLKDILAFRTEFERQRQADMEVLAAEAQELGMGY